MLTVTITVPSEIMQWKVSLEESGMKLQAFLKQKLGETLSARQIKQAIENKFCTVNKRLERFASALVGAGDLIELKLDSATSQVSTVAIPKFEPSRILFEDEDLLIYDKPPFIASDNEKFLLNLKRTLPYLALVHRLDKETTGALIFAKNETALTQMLELFKQRLVNKIYLALVDRCPEKSNGIIDNYLGELKRYQGQTLWGSVPKSKGLHAITAWERLRFNQQAALIRCFPKTGRTHQIRVHLSEMGCPILGDFQYGKNFQCNFRPARYLLHASEISFIHPRTGKNISAASPLPSDFLAAIEKVLGA